MDSDLPFREDRRENPGKIQKMGAKTGKNRENLYHAKETLHVLKGKKQGQGLRKMSEGKGKDLKRGEQAREGREGVKDQIGARVKQTEKWVRGSAVLPHLLVQGDSFNPEHIDLD